MDVRVEFVFNNPELGPGFEIQNPPVLPENGDILNFDWESYLSDKRQISLIHSFEQEHSFVAQIVGKAYSPKQVVVTVSLHKDVDYEEYEAERRSSINLKP